MVCAQNMIAMVLKVMSFYLILHAEIILPSILDLLLSSEDLSQGPRNLGILKNGMIIGASVRRN